MNDCTTSRTTVLQNKAQMNHCTTSRITVLQNEAQMNHCTTGRITVLRDERQMYHCISLSEMSIQQYTVHYSLNVLTVLNGFCFSPNSWLWLYKYNPVSLSHKCWMWDRKKLWCYHQDYHTQTPTQPWWHKFVRFHNTQHHYDTGWYNDIIP